MHTGKVKRIVRDRGFGFISDNSGAEVFFHRSAADGFDGLNEGDQVTFNVEESPKGPRASDVRKSL